MTLSIEVGGISDPDVRRALDQIAMQFPLGPAQIMPVAAGTSLPFNPVNGQDYYHALSGGGVWHLKYNATAGKWDFAGGPPLYAEVVTDETTASLAYVALATAGPSIALPFAGDYDVEIGANMFENTVNTANFMSYDIGATVAVDADSIKQGQPSAGTGAVVHANGARSRRKTGLTAVTLTAKYRVTGGTGDFRDRWMRVTPVRVG